jgi:signal transduction histidine kinase
LRGLTAYADAGSRTEAATRFPVSDAVETARWNSKKAIEANGAAVVFEGEEITIHARQRALTEVLARLIDNSAKFAGPAPRVTISARQDADSVVIEVRDTGPGFDANSMHLLFTPFHRNHGRQYPGHGLGLAICRRTVEAMGGEILAGSSDPGARITIRLPA